MVEIEEVGKLFSDYQYLHNGWKFCLSFEIKKKTIFRFTNVPGNVNTFVLRGFQSIFVIWDFKN